jgi:hypothetical protein
MGQTRNLGLFRVKVIKSFANQKYEASELSTSVLEVVRRKAIIKILHLKLTE